jgi:hypothetical protein
MEADARQSMMTGQEAYPFLPETVRTQGRSVRLHDNEVVVRKPLAEPQKLLGLRNAMPVQLGNQGVRERYGAALPAFRFLVSDPCARLFGRADDRQSPSGERAMPEIG